MADDEKLTTGRSPLVPSQKAGTSALILVTGDRSDIEYTERFVQDQSVDDLLVLACGPNPTPAIERTERIDVDGRKRLLTDANIDLTADDTTVERVSDSTNLSTTGIEISSLLDDDGGTVVCVHSLTALLEDVETERLFRFLHVLTSRIAAADAMGQFYLDAAAHDDQTIYMLRSAFDTVVQTGTVPQFSD